MKFNLHGYSSPDWKRPPSPPWKRQNNISTPRTHIYIECEAPLQHHKNTDNDNDNNNTYYTFWDVQGGGRSSHKYQSLWSFTQKIMEYQWVCCHLLSPYLIHPTLVLRFPPSPTARTSRTRSRRSHFLFFITGTCCLFVFHHWKTQVRYPLLHHWKTLLLSTHLRNRVGDCIHIWS